MFSRSKALIAALSMALQAAELLIAGIGHDHDSDLHACRHDACHCGHDQESPHADSRELSPEHGPGSPHDDCVVCRHFSQPAAPVAVTLEVAASGLVEAYVLPAVPAAAVFARPVHAARGPPCFV